MNTINYCDEVKNDIFIQNIYDNKTLNGNTLNGNNIYEDNGWLVINYDKYQNGNLQLKNDHTPIVEKVSFFIITKFSVDDNNLIYNNISNKNNLIFDNNGNIGIKNNNQIIKSWINPLNITPDSSSNSESTNQTRNVLDTTKTLLNISTQSGQGNQNFINSIPTKAIMTLNLKFILYNVITTNSTTGIIYNQYYLLYNPLHRKKFKDYYNSIPEEHFNNNGIANNCNPTFNMSQLFNNYCNSLKVKDESTGLSSFIDPTCLVLSDLPSLNQCSYSALLNSQGGNFVYETKDITGAMSSALNNISNNILPLCLCQGNLGQYSLGAQNESFYPDLKTRIVGPNKNNCPNSVNICTNIVSSGDNTNMSDIKTTNNCGNPNIVPPALREPSNKIITGGNNVINPSTPATPATPATPSTTDTPATPATTSIKQIAKTSPFIYLLIILLTLSIILTTVYFIKHKK